MLRLPYLLVSICLLLAAGCKDPDLPPGNPEDFPEVPASYRYNIRGDLETDQFGKPTFVRAGTYVLVYFGSRTAPQKLELAYEETREHETGEFRVQQVDTIGGFAMYYQNFREQYWQQSGTIEITYSSDDTIIGRMDQVILTYPDADSLKAIEVTGEFEAY